MTLLRSRVQYPVRTRVCNRPWNLWCHQVAAANHTISSCRAIGVNGCGRVSETDSSQLTTTTGTVSGRLVGHNTIAGPLLIPTAETAELREVGKFRHAVHRTCPHASSCLHAIFVFRDATPERILNSVSVRHRLSRQPQNLQAGKFRSTPCLKF